MVIKNQKIIFDMFIVLILLVCLFIAADLYFINKPWWSFHKEKGCHASTVKRLRHLYFEIKGFEREKGRFPTDLKEIKEYLKIESSKDRRNYLFIDGWKRPLRYVVENPRLNEGSFDLYSVGENGKDEYDKPKFGDDIHVLADGSIREPAVKK